MVSWAGFPGLGLFGFDFVSDFPNFGLGLLAALIWAFLTCFDFLD